MAIKLSQELKQVQKLSPLQMQTIKLIELPIMDMRQQIRRMVEDNFVLDESVKVEEEDSEQPSQEVSLSDYKDDNVPFYNYYVNNRGKDAPESFGNDFSVKESFTDSLRDQLGCRNLSEQDKAVADFIIGSLDASGYLRRDLDSLVDDMAFRFNIETSYEEVLRVLGIIQELEPAGVGARDLRECLLLQLHRAPDTPVNRDAVEILEKYFNDFSSKHFDRIMQRMNISSERLKAARARILRLNPAPGGQNEDSYADRAQQVVPDFIVTVENGEPVVNMPKFKIPELKVNKRYAEMLERGEHSKDKSDKDAATFVRQKLDSAKWFVEALKQRQNTLQKTMDAIVKYQRDFFLDGDDSNLRPMALKDIAAMTGFDISTVSRVVNSKYVETSSGIYSLKYFFSEGMENADGEEVSTRELKAALQQIISEEDKRKPYTDDALVTMMTQRGYKVARRTIAKYREQLGINTARLRREI